MGAAAGGEQGGGACVVKGERAIAPGDRAVLPKIGGVEGPGVKLGQAEGVAEGIDQVEISRPGEFGEELAAMRARVRLADGDGRKRGAAVEGTGGDKTFAVDREAEMRAGELEVAAEDEVAGVGFETDRADEKAGDWRAGEGAGGFDNRRMASRVSMPVAATAAAGITPAVA